MPLRLASGFTPYLFCRTLIFLVWSLRLCLYHIPPLVLSYCFIRLMMSYRNHPFLRQHLQTQSHQASLQQTKSFSLQLPLSRSSKMPQAPEATT